MEPLIDIDNLSYAIGGQPILHDISAAFETGLIHGIIGPNGAGKSTLLRNLCRIWEPAGGSVMLNGRDLRHFRRRELSQMITLVPQESRVDFSIRVFDFIAMGRHSHLGRFSWLGRHDLGIIEQAMEVTATQPFKDRVINQLSGGESQLVSIARALVTEAPIILLDEPTSSLDIQHKLQIMELLTRLKAQGKTILMSLHDLDLARRYCDTLMLLQSGRLYCHAPTEQAFQTAHIRQVFHVDIEESETPHGVSLLFYA
ncbi:ABC transporter ATP-binding protein [uncultured Desulfuromonas sp.]|uniref:ABC transporter ATP-binding protein n=1 Tax=uncultured Desulfuromonas sp. TaxID=181013 RepID=UPI002AAAAD60|nr:ABC transporter ATP-binding protein [uncultured Desulfuromonas sp.]